MNILKKIGNSILFICLAIMVIAVILMWFSMCIKDPQIAIALILTFWFVKSIAASTNYSAASL